MEEFGIRALLLKILIIINTDTNYSVLQSFIKNNFDNVKFLIATSLLEAKNCLLEHDFDCIIVNHQSIDESGIKDLSDLIKRPIITVVESKDELIALEIMRTSALKHLDKSKNHKRVTKLILCLAYKNNYPDKQKEYYLTLQQKLTANTELIIFSLDNEGPSLLYNLEKTSFSDFDIIKMQNFFYVSIGQGNNYNIGLYELPVPMYPNHIAIVYAFLISDKFNVDPRNKKTNYCLICYIMPKYNRIFIHHIDIISILIKEQITLYKELDELKNPQNLVTVIPRFYIF